MNHCCTQAGNFFAAYHSENLEGLHGMLDKELWRRIPSGNAGVPPTNHDYFLSQKCLAQISAPFLS